MNALPAHLANRQRRDIATAAIGGINVGAGPHISIKDNRFTIVDGAGNAKPVMQLFLDVCIIDVNASVSKIFFDPNVKYDPSGENNNPPLCFSDNGVGASAQASYPQNTSCMACPHNVWGSAQSQMTGKQTKACNDVKKMAVVIPGDPSQLVYLLRVPPASLKNLAKYTQTVAGHGVDLPDVVTRLEFESQGVLKFTPTGYVDEATAWLTDKAWKEDATVRVVGKNDMPWNGQQLAAPQQNRGVASMAPPQQQQTAFMPPQQQAPVASPASPNMFQGGQMQPPPGPFAPTAATPFQPSQQTAFSAPPAAEPPKRTRKPRTPAAAAAPEVPSFIQPQGQQEVIPPGAPFVAPSAVAQPGPATAPPSGPFASPAPTNSGPVDTSIPPFLQRNPGPPAAPPQPQNFGMQPNAPAPDAGVQAALDAAFNLPTGT